MKIEIQLSEESIAHAISELQKVQENIDYGLKQTVEMLSKEGAAIANAAYGGMATADYRMDGNTGIIEASSKDEDALIIAEFGAGQATMPVMFENEPGVSVYEGSYSESEKGSGEYAQYGSWHFGGKYYTEVPARHGLLDAKQYIIEKATEMAQEVIKL